MTVERAFRLLKLPADASHQQLLVNYRRLVKRVHPDYNSHRQEWSHKAMTTVNLAYETVRTYLDEEPAEHNQAQDKQRRSRSERKRESTNSRTHTGYRADSYAASNDHERPAEFASQFASIVNAILNGMYLYYQYGLENVHLRHEGVRRFRYRSSVKQIESGIERLKSLETMQKTQEELEHFVLFRDFSRAFLQNMRINKYYIAQRMPGEHKAYQHYANGSTHLDKAIKSRFFEELESGFQDRSIAGGLKISYHEFMTVLVKYANSTWIPETVIKIYLLDLFQKVARLDMAG